MTEKVSLLLGVHAHQPAGNFPEVVEKAHDLCYRPFLQTLHRYAGFRFALHASGPLLDTLFERYPDDMRLLREMVERGQVELFGAGDTEPVLAVIPERDRVTQIRALSDKIEREFGQRPDGAWLTERVWEATVVPALAGCDIRYVTVDDYHFLCAGKSEADLTGYFTTEEGGQPLDLFPISEPLRYRIPFAPAPEWLPISRASAIGVPARRRSTLTTSRSSASGRKRTSGCTARAGSTRSSAACSPPTASRRGRSVSSTPRTARAASSTCRRPRTSR